MINPKLLCNKHLLGEHSEIHKHLNVFVKKYSIKNRVLKGKVQIEPLSMKTRHDELALEIANRWPKNKEHKSPYEHNVQKLCDHLLESEKNAKVDKAVSYQDLIVRCEECRKRIENERLSNNI
jgi:site-specific recombinase